MLAAASAAGACRQSATAPTDPSQTVDTLEFVVGDAALWPRTGDQLQDQTVDRDRREVCFVKYGRADMYECWRWDDAWIYHVVDHALDGDTGESYRFTDGRWLPRRLLVGGAWSLLQPANRIRWFTRGCSEVRGPEGMRIDDGPNVFPIALRAWIEPARDVGGDLGEREVLVLAYATFPPGGQPGAPELFSFARGAGWFKWESPRGNRAFAELGGVSVARASGCGGA